MKRFLALAIAVVFVLGFAASAMAANLDVTGDGMGIKLTGEYRIKGVSTNNTSGPFESDPYSLIGDKYGWIDDPAKDHVQFINQRLRMQLGVMVAEGITVTTRFDIAEGNFDGTAQTKNGTEVDVDLAWIHFDDLFGLSWDMGLQPSSWGNGFWVWGSMADRIKIVKKLDNGLVGFHYTKVDETNGTPATAGGGGDDIDAYTVFASFTAGDHKISPIVVIQEDHGDPVACTPLDIACMLNPPRSKDGQVIDVAYSGKAGSVNLAAEIAMLSGEAYESEGYAIGNNEDPMGFFVAANMDVTDTINVGIAYAMAENGYVADDDFGPTLLFGTNVNPNAITNFGATTMTATCNADPAAFGGWCDWGRGDDSTSAIVLSAKMKQSDALTIGANIAQANLANTQYKDPNPLNIDMGSLLEGERAVDLTEIDIYANYNLTTNTTFFVGYAMGMPSYEKSGNPGDMLDTIVEDNITSAAWQLSTKF